MGIAVFEFLAPGIDHSVPESIDGTEHVTIQFQLAQCVGSSMSRRPSVSCT